MSVTVTDDARLFKDRGTWIGDPVLRRPDGSVELVVNLPWMETIAQDGAFADSRLTRLRHAIASLDGAERMRLARRGVVCAHRSSSTARWADVTRRT